MKLTRKVFSEISGIDHSVFASLHLVGSLDGETFSKQITLKAEQPCDVIPSVESSVIIKAARALYSEGCTKVIFACHSNEGYCDRYGYRADGRRLMKEYIAKHLNNEECLVFFNDRVLYEDEVVTIQE